MRIYARPLLAIAALLAGCDAAQNAAQNAQQAANQAQKAVVESTEATKAAIQEQAGGSELTLNGPVKTAACYVNFTPAVAGRASLLTLQSYRSAESEVFPSLYVQAQVPTASLTELVGQTVTAQMFVKPTATGPTWATDPAHGVQLKIVAIDGAEVTAELACGELLPSDGGVPFSPTGKFTAVVRE
jgi:hypothetical protein